MFGYPVMPVGEFGDLGQMGDAKHLVMPGKPRKLAADNLSNASADAGIDFIKYDGFYRIGLRQDGFERQNHPGQLSSGSNA